MFSNINSIRDSELLFALSTLLKVILLSLSLVSRPIVKILEDSPPLSSTFGCLYPHRKLQEPKVRLFMDYIAKNSKQHIKDLLEE